MILIRSILEKLWVKKQKFLVFCFQNISKTTTDICSASSSQQGRIVYFLVFLAWQIDFNKQPIQFLYNLFARANFVVFMTCRNSRICSPGLRRRLKENCHVFPANNACSNNSGRKQLVHGEKKKMKKWPPLYPRNVLFNQADRWTLQRLRLRPRILHGTEVKRTSSG